mgnify:CR=1 FL=1
MPDYLLLKALHIITVIFSICGFLLRSYWRFYSPQKLHLRSVKLLPHINDTLLLLSAIALTVVLGQYPFSHDWLTAKVLLLLLYIVAGSIALKTRFPAKQSLLAFLVALGSFSAIVMIALRQGF